MPPRRGSNDRRRISDTSADDDICTIIQSLLDCTIPKIGVCGNQRHLLRIVQEGQTVFRQLYVGICFVKMAEFAIAKLCKDLLCTVEQVVAVDVGNLVGDTLLTCLRYN